MAKEFPDRVHIVLGSLKDWERTETVVNSLTELKNVSTVDTDTIEKTVSLMKSADLLISNDTGIMHIAMTCNTPTVEIFQGKPYRYWPRYDIHGTIFPEINYDVVSVEETYDISKKLLDNISHAENNY